MKPAETLVPFRIVVLEPVPGVVLMLQRGRCDLVAPVHRSAAAVFFEFELRLGPPSGSSQLRWLGDFAQGTPTDRFVYVNAGIRAGQTGTPWDRRAKIKLAGITRRQVDQALATPGLRLEARIQGAGRDGGPCCATVPLLDGGWRVGPKSG